MRLQLQSLILLILFLYVGDFLYDIQAANNAKMHACLYLNENDMNQLPVYANAASFICRDFDSFETDVQSYLASVGF